MKKWEQRRKLHDDFDKYLRSDKREGAFVMSFPEPNIKKIADIEDVPLTEDLLDDLNWFPLNTPLHTEDEARALVTREIQASGGALKMSRRMTTSKDSFHGYLYTYRPSKEDMRGIRVKVAVTTEGHFAFDCHITSSIENL